ncbi:DUF397 domain-containing protein [Streptomyces melanosporofaciens]|uniref:DUF397 domain-containing protein n=1 Tax=Streptomyces melanosporofaciens TaxID=67327 RepID=A0A1H4MAT0_STRMJ|nr:DUF397 domain-containing protein [Streptomyces melanosporofaciens]SEB79937.1 protein of unknown function [Streptomyces melanosporofaciens]
MATKPQWRTSSYTKSDTCVEVADNTPGVVLVRDSNHRDGGCLTLRPAIWSSFVDFVKAGAVLH